MGFEQEPRLHSTDKKSGAGRIGLVQQGNLRFLETALWQQWCLGRNIMLCWAPTDTGIELLMAPHYFLGSFSATLNDCPVDDRLEALNGAFIRQLIAGQRHMSLAELRGTARRLELEPVAIALPAPLAAEAAVLAAVDALVCRHSISFVESRAVLLFDIVDFSLFTPFEQTSQLASLSYSLNAACSKLQRKHIQVNMARSTTGDGFYVWSRDATPRASMQLYQLMLLTLADNAIARAKAPANTVPLLRTGFHIGSHYEFYQSEGLNPTLYSYIVGDVTIELARMLHIAQAGQIFVGDFNTRIPTSSRESAYLVEVDTVRFVERARRQMEELRGVEISGEEVDSIHCFLTGEAGVGGGKTVRRFRIVDKHGRARLAYNLRINIHTPNRPALLLGIQQQGPASGEAEPERPLIRGRRVRQRASIRDES